MSGSETKNSPLRFPILNTYVNALSLDETVAEVEKIVAAGVPTQHVVVNASKVNLMEADPKLAEIVNACPPDQCRWRIGRVGCEETGSPPDGARDGHRLISEACRAVV